MTVFVSADDSRSPSVTGNAVRTRLRDRKKSNALTAYTGASAPLARVRTDLETLVSQPRSTREYEEAVRGAAVDLRALSALLDDLVLLAAGDRVALESRFDVVDVERVLAATLTRSKAGLTVTTDGERPFLLHGSEQLLARALADIIGLTVDADDGSRDPQPAGTHIVLGRHKGRLVIEVTHQATGGRNGGGAYGLASQVAEAHRGRLTTGSDARGGATVMLSLPVS